MARAEPAQECERVGEGMADIVGIGIIVGFVGQALLSLLLAGWVFLLSKYGNLDLHHEKDTVEHQIDRKRLESVSDILMVGNDIQMLLGISYMVNTFALADSIDLYHLHLVFDIVSFVGVSNAAAMICWTFCTYKLEHPGPRPNKFVTYWAPRHRVAYTFAGMFLALTILLCVRLDEWAPDADPGRCYHATLITGTTNDHPGADKVYVAVTGSWMLIAMGSAIFLGATRRRWVLVSAFLQFPVHLYMAIALRSENQGKLEGEESSENDWDFGQTTAVVLLGVAVAECRTKLKEYVAFERGLRKKGRAESESARPKTASLERPRSEDLSESLELRDLDEERGGPVRLARSIVCA